MSTAVRPLLPVLSVHSSCAMRRPDGCVTAPLTRTPSQILTPRLRAPLASARVRSAGFAFPIPPQHTPPAPCRVGSRHERIAPPRLYCGDHVTGDAERLGDRRRSLQLDHAVRRAG